jgi:RNA polymerase sigma-70 factor (ECF subfamily)
MLMDAVGPDSAETQRLLAQVRGGDREALNELLAQHRPYLERFVELCLDPELRPRVDPSDVVQEAHLEAMRRLSGYLAQPPMPFRLWLRQLARDRLLRLRRRHVRAARRAVGREVPLPDRSSLQLAQQLLAAGPTPEQQLDQEELARRIRQGLAELSDADREILLLRNFEGLSYAEIGYILAIEPAAARKRHGRAVVRLHRVLFGGGPEESQL